MLRCMKYWVFRSNKLGKGVGKGICEVQYLRVDSLTVRAVVFSVEVVARQAKYCVYQPKALKHVVTRLLKGFLSIVVLPASELLPAAVRVPIPCRPNNIA